MNNECICHLIPMFCYFHYSPRALLAIENSDRHRHNHLESNGKCREHRVQLFFSCINSYLRAVV